MHEHTQRRRTTSEALTVLGLSGGSCPVRPMPDALSESRMPAPPTSYHDSAAVPVRGGEVVAAIEEERLNRLKHTNRFAAQATRACLRIAGLTLDDIDRFAFYGAEPQRDAVVRHYMIDHPRVPQPLWTARDYLADVLSHDLEGDVDSARLTFVEHHEAHALSAYLVGPFADALVVTLDGEGDSLSGTVWAGRQGELQRLLNLPRRSSLGRLYTDTIRYLAYELFDAYKVMGLAPYGDPRRFEEIFEGVCRLQPNGLFEIKWSQLERIRELLPQARRSGEPFTDVHKDLAAALQATVERATLHLLTHYQAETGLRHLCLAGGVAHNSTMIGKITRSGLFDGVFTQPASHDAGCALGAALGAYRELDAAARFAPMSHVYWGLDIGSGPTVGAQLDAWGHVVDVRRLRNVANDVAHLLANGAVIGWVQGRSEFGPRALGNRSILADPRPASNRQRINDLIKQREAYRPFAPAVLEEHAHELFEMPPGTSSGAFMTYTVPVRAQYRSTLGAVTHVDGTARIQTVSKTTNERFWSLVSSFHALTGTPVLLNTSFNHSVEPIVDSVDDAVACFLTTGLTHLVVDEYLVTKRELAGARLLRLAPTIPAYVRVTRTLQTGEDDRVETRYRCEHMVTPSQSGEISPNTYRVLESLDGVQSVAALMDPMADADQVSKVLDELEWLWSRRLLRFLPPDAAQRAQKSERVAETASVGADGRERIDGGGPPRRPDARQQDHDR